MKIVELAVFLRTCFPESSLLGFEIDGVPAAYPSLDYRLCSFLVFEGNGGHRRSETALDDPRDQVKQVQTRNASLFRIY